MAETPDEKKQRENYPTPEEDEDCDTDPVHRERGIDKAAQDPDPKNERGKRAAEDKPTEPPCPEGYLD